jgi:hypothetical protein
MTQFVQEVSLVLPDPCHDQTMTGPCYWLSFVWCFAFRCWVALFWCFGFSFCGALCPEVSWCLGFGVCGSGVGGWGLGFRVWGSGRGVWGFGFKRKQGFSAEHVPEDRSRNRPALKTFSKERRVPVSAYGGS